MASDKEWEEVLMKRKRNRDCLSAKCSRKTTNVRAFCSPCFKKINDIDRWAIQQHEREYIEGMLASMFKESTVMSMI